MQPPTPRQQHHAHLVREAWWLALTLGGLFLAAILLTYSRQDPSWSHIASEDAVIHNAGGAVGAWVSDMLLYLFGFSAWWWVVLAFYSVWLVYHRLEMTISERPFLIFNLADAAITIGVVIILARSLFVREKQPETSDADAAQAPSET